MVLAAAALSPFLPQLKPEFRWAAVAAGACSGVGYISQSMALSTLPASTVAESFCGHRLK